MKVSVLSLSLGIAAVVAAAAPAHAGEWSAAGIADYNRSVAVPAPIPIPVNRAQWYLRGDIGYNVGESGTIITSGAPVSTYEFDGGDQSFVMGFGVGHYLSRNFRLELAADWTNERTVSRAAGSASATLVTLGPVHVDGPTSEDTLTYTGSFNHKGTLHSSDIIFNLLYDLDTGSAFKPYIGGGLGLSIHRLRVVGDTNMTCSNLARDYDPDPVNPPLDDATMPCSAALVAPEPINSRVSNTVTAYGLAAAAMVGVGYEIYPGVLWDTGYRFMYRGGTAAIGFNGTTENGTIEISDRMDHEIRTGIRFDLF